MTEAMSTTSLACLQTMVQVVFCAQHAYALCAAATASLHCALAPVPSEMTSQCRMAILGLTEQFLLRRVQEGSPHYVHCLEQLENFAEAMAVSHRQQDLFGEEFDSDEEESNDPLGGPAPRKRSAQGRIECVQTVTCLQGRVTLGTRLRISAGPTKVGQVAPVLGSSTTVIGALCPDI
jgi:hypothetical protein